MAKKRLLSQMPPILNVIFGRDSSTSGWIKKEKAAK